MLPLPAKHDEEGLLFVLSPVDGVIAQPGVSGSAPTVVRYARLR
jgi:hypothetical protein